ncbi:hypothetical protein DID77_03055 [Candidatus Marinamargulisbacteria bacterium SCGC AG-439-L15]|nr:hypothetical protein DID77_03055 [Candidatus Marinamargulisbacteria bacterium SCGC AG-439-L15]
MYKVVAGRGVSEFSSVEFLNHYIESVRGDLGSVSVHEPVGFSFERNFEKVFQIPSYVFINDGSKVQSKRRIIRYDVYANQEGQRIVVGGLLGTGSFGRVQCYWSVAQGSSPESLVGNDADWVIKSGKISGLEVEMSVQLGSLGISPEANVVYIDGEVCIVMKRVSPLSKEDVSMRLLYQMEQLVLYMQEEGFVSVDLKREHFAKDDKGCLCMIDNGGTGTRASHGLRKKLSGTAGYGLPATLQDVNIHDKSSFTDKEWAILKLNQQFALYVSIFELLFGTDKGTGWQFLSQFFKFERNFDFAPEKKDGIQAVFALGLFNEEFATGGLSIQTANDTKEMMKAVSSWVGNLHSQLKNPSYLSHLPKELRSADTLGTIVTTIIYKLNGILQDLNNDADMNLELSNPILNELASFKERQERELQGRAWQEESDEGISSPCSENSDSSNLSSFALVD